MFSFIPREFVVFGIMGVVVFIYILYIRWEMKKATIYHKKRIKSKK